MTNLTDLIALHDKALKLDYELMRLSDHTYLAEYLLREALVHLRNRGVKTI